MLAKFKQLVQESQLPKASQTWFPKQLQQFCSLTSQNPESPLDCSRPTVEMFLRHLKKSGKAAWQRLQALEAIQYYAKKLLLEVDPELDVMRRPQRAPLRTTIIWCFVREVHSRFRRRVAWRGIRQFVMRVYFGVGLIGVSESTGRFNSRREAQIDSIASAVA